MRINNPSKRLIALMLALFALALTLSACNPLGDEEAQASADDLVAQIPLPDDGAAQAEDTFVGLTENGIGVGIVVHDGAAVAYICDGRELGHWLKGNLDGDAIDLEHAAGTQLEAELVDDAISGTVTLSDGETLAFSATPAVKEGSGLFRTTELQEGFVYGWIVLVDDAGLVTVQGLGQDSKTKAIDGEISTDVINRDLDFGVPEKGSSPPVELQETSGLSTSELIDLFSCETLEANRAAHVAAGQGAKSKALQDAYFAAAWTYADAWNLKGCGIK